MQVYLAEMGKWYGPEDDCDGTLCKDAGYPEGAYLRPDLGGGGLEATPFLSVFHSLWFMMVTLTTVGA
jgi:hypothetical protein